MNDHLLPTDTGWREDKALIADLSRLNVEIARYVLRYFDADAGRAEPIRADDERDFGQRLIDLGEQVQRRATTRAVQGEAAPHRALDPGNRPDTDHSP